MASNNDDQIQITDLKTFITSREIVTESFLRDVIDSLPEPPNSSAVELARVWKEEAKKRIADMSVTLSHKVQPIVQILLDQKLANSMDKSFSTIETIEPSVLDMTLKYTKCFDAWVDAEQCVSFRATNTRLLGLVGQSTAGKSTFFEACLMEGSHVTTNESGVGRFQVGNKPVLMFHDINIRTLAVGKDSEKIKTIARTEPTVTKIHGNVITLPPLFLFYSSNERLMSHKFEEPNAKLSFNRLYASQVNETGKKRISDETILALQNRFIEAFVRSPPFIDKNDLPHSGGFQRIHGILGLFRRITRIMKHYKTEDFYSPVLIQYVMHGLCANCSKHTEITNADGSNVLRQLVDKHVHPQLQQSLINML